MELIDKAAVVAEIEKRVNEYPCDNSEQDIGYHCALFEMEDFINSLAVKNDVPLEGILIHGNNDAYKIGYTKATEKACEWLYKRQQVDLVVPNIEKFIDDFRKAMEE